MRNSDIDDPLFLEAVEAIDAGNISELKRLLNSNPELVNKRLDINNQGYFNHPFLLWFVADNPIRHEKLPATVVEIARLLIDKVKQYAPDCHQQQLDYTLGLVATGRIPRDCAVQIPLIDLLIEAGAKPGSVMGALAQNNIDAAAHLIKYGGKLNLAAAVCLDRSDDITRLAMNASIPDKQVALTAAAFYGKSPMIRFLLALGTDPNAFLENAEGFHSHATALHQAVSSGSLDSVKILVEAGANPELRDRVYDGTAIDWAQYMQTDGANDTDAKKRLKEIENYLLKRRTNKNQ